MIDASNTPTVSMEDPSPRRFCLGEIWRSGNGYRYEVVAFASGKAKLRRERIFGKCRTVILTDVPEDWCCLLGPTSREP